MSYVDLQATLRDWVYDSEQISVRKILGTDGSVRIQMRVELGIVQMESENRPDGTRPHGYPSLLDYNKARLAKYEQANGTTLGFVLSPKQCQDLRAEASLYYRRFVALFVLEEYDLQAEDTAHNLAIFDLCKDYGREKEDRDVLESFRPYVLMMDARAHAYRALDENEPASALAHVNRGILHLRSHFETSGMIEPHTTGDALDQYEEMRILRSFAAELSSQMPTDSLVVTRKALREAIEHERFEEAARLRDTLKEQFNIE